MYDPNFDSECSSYEREVNAEIERMVRDGEGAPFDVIDRAHRRVQAHRRAKAAERRRQSFNERMELK